MKAILIWNILTAGALATACALTACHTPHPSPSEFRCGFSDPETMANLGICEFAAEYYVAHHRWPFSKAQMQSQVQVDLKELKSEITPEEAKALTQFLDHYTVLEFHPKGADLILHYRVRVERRNFEHTVILQPGRTTDEILERSTDADSPPNS